MAEGNISKFEEDVWQVSRLKRGQGTFCAVELT